MIVNCVYGVPLLSNGSAPGMGGNPDWEYSSSTCVISGISTSTPLGFNPTTTISSSSDVTVYGYMSAGELLIGALLFCFVLLYGSVQVLQALGAVKVKKQFINYQGGAVEITEKP